MREQIGFDEFDDGRMDAEDKAREAEKRRAGALAMQAALDAETLVGNPAFVRYFFTVLARAGIYRAAFHAQQGRQDYEAGRRALGIELLDELLRIDPQMAIALSVEQAKLEKKVNDAPGT
jgi:hypothetical protein